MPINFKGPSQNAAPNVERKSFFTKENSKETKQNRTKEGALKQQNQDQNATSSSENVT